MKILAINIANQFILKKHHLTEDTKINNILQITNDLCGLHATETISPYLTLFTRTNSFNKEELDRLLYKEKKLGRIRGMRKTLFIETIEMIPIVHNSIKSLTKRRDEQYLEIREISKEEYDILSKTVLEMLREKEMATTEIKKALTSQKDIVAIISIMCDQMLLIRGRPLKSWKDRRIFYAPFDKYFPNIKLDEYSQEQAISLLIQKYITSYGPVTIKDITWWLGTNKRQVLSIIDNLETNFERISLSNLNLEYYICKNDLVRLQKLKSFNINILNFLPRLDPYIMGYKDRGRYVDTKNFNYIYDRSGNGTSTIILNGRVIGIWDIIENPNPMLKVFLFEVVEENIIDKIKIEGKKIGKFMTDQVLPIKICDEMTPLTNRTMGGYMSPLKDSN